MNWRVPLADLDYDDEEKQAVLRVLESKWLTLGSVTADFEKRFAEAVGAKHAIAVANGTVALHLACRVGGIGPGDEVIVPSLTFVATANAALYTGAEVRFADICSLEDLNIAPGSIEALITPATKAIVIVHYGGYPARMPEIMALARQHGLFVIEDAAHSPGASLNGQFLGAWGDVGCFSFFSNKNMATGEGGMIVTNRDDLAETLRLLRSHGMTSLTWDRHQGHSFSYDVVELGYNYRIDEIRSALGVAQLSKLQANNSRREAITRRYRQAFKDTGLIVPFSATPGQPACHIFPLLAKSSTQRQQLMQALKEQSIQTSIHYPLIHQFSYYRARYADVHLPVSEEAANRELTLPLYPSMHDADVDFVIEQVLKNIE
jgi:dTDP-4-amino-4,6-dideoxygalactose transaminase